MSRSGVRASGRIRPCHTNTTALFADAAGAFPVVAFSNTMYIIYDSLAVVKHFCENIFSETKKITKSLDKCRTMCYNPFIQIKDQKLSPNPIH